MMSGDEFYDDDVTSGPVDPYERQRAIEERIAPTDVDLTGLDERHPDWPGPAVAHCDHSEADGCADCPVSIESDDILGGWRVKCVDHGRLTTRAERDQAEAYAADHIRRLHPTPKPLSLRDELLARWNGDPKAAAGELAFRLSSKDPADPWKAPYTQPNAVLAAAEMFDLARETVDDQLLPCQSFRCGHPKFRHLTDDHHAHNAEHPCLDCLYCKGFEAVNAVSDQPVDQLFDELNVIATAVSEGQTYSYRGQLEADILALRDRWANRLDPEPDSDVAHLRGARAE